MKKSVKRLLWVAVSVPVLAVPVVTLMGNNIRRLLGASAESLAGDPSFNSVPSTPSRPQAKVLRDFSSQREEAGPLAGRAAPSPAPARAPTPSRPPPVSGNTHVAYKPNPFTLTREDRFSTFAADVDTASYTLFRRYSTEGALPPPESIRVEEWMNYFTYRYPEPTQAQGDFGVDLEAAPSPFTPGRHLVKVGVQGRGVPQSERKPTHLVFLVDISGSMASADKLPLAQQSMKLMVRGLNPTDTVALVTYAGGVRDVLPPTPAAEEDTLFAGIDALSAGGGTNMGSGMELAYRHALKQVRPGHISRVVVLTDGDANIGRTTVDSMFESVQGAVKEGVTLSTIGFGMGNHRDSLMEQLADRGNGNCYYIDGEREARRLFQERLGGTLQVIAQDVKLQVEFAPETVRGYRLLGYENRDIADRDFREDKVDAGEIGAGHTVTALYEVELTGEGTHLATVRVRAKRPGGVEAAEQRFELERSQVHASLRQASSNLRFAAAVAGTADILRGAPQAGDWSLATAESLAESAVDGLADRAEFLGLLRLTRSRHAASVASGVPD